MSRPTPTSGCLLMCILSWMGTVSAEGVPDPERPRILPRRAEEDWSALRSESQRVEALDAAKYIPLGADDFYLTLGGQVRAQHELAINEAYGATPQDDSGSWLLRNVLHGDVHIGPHFRGFVQLHAIFETGRDGGPTPVDVDRLDLAQGFIEVTLGDRRTTSRPSLSVQLGRQELFFGAGRLYDVRDGPNVRRSFDVTRLKLETPEVVADAFVGLEVPIRDGVFDNAGDERPLTWGTHWSTRPGLLGPMGFDAYYFGLAQSRLAYARDAGDEVRQSIGGRWWSLSPHFRHDVEVTYQVGRLDTASGSLDIRAWGVAASADYTFDPEGLRATLSLGGGVASGDDNPRDDKLETFRSPFPNLRFAGVTTRLGPSNLWGLNPGFSIDPVPRWLHLGLVGRVFFRSSIDDAVYSPVGFPHPVVGDGRFVGAGGTAVLAGRINTYASAHVMLDLFRPTSLIAFDSPPELSAFSQVGAQFVF